MCHVGILIEHIQRIGNMLRFFGGENTLKGGSDSKNSKKNKRRYVSTLPSSELIGGPKKEIWTSDGLTA